MRQYYASDKKRREDARKKHQAEKRLKKLNKTQKSAGQENPSATGTTADGATLPETTE